ncbi:CsgG/HfaB family protein [Parvibaculum sp.]|uniref:CsgG/HfaB family protein n=1 Tax=Parvibaculum sp. TaxID=2024848 RepID=UPI00320C8F20
MSGAIRRFIAVSSVGALALAQAACAVPDAAQKINEEAKVMEGPAPRATFTPMDTNLRCVAHHIPPGLDLRLAVNDLTDGSGAQASGDAHSTILTQRPDMMFVIALAKTGVRLVNRNSTAVAEWEMKRAMDKQLGEGKLVSVQGKEFAYRPVTAGTIVGSTHFVSGALTELNWSIKSDVAEAGVGGLTAGSRKYYISVGADLMLTNTKTTELVMARSYSKQIVGSELSAGLFRFFEMGGGTNWGPKEIFEFNLGSQANEPVQAAVRWLLELAAYDMVSELTGADKYCDTPELRAELGKEQIRAENAALTGNSLPTAMNEAAPVVTVGPQTNAAPVGFVSPAQTVAAPAAAPAPVAAATSQAAAPAPAEKQAAAPAPAEKQAALPPPAEKQASTPAVTATESSASTSSLPSEEQPLTTPDMPQQVVTSSSSTPDDSSSTPVVQSSLSSTQPLSNSSGSTSATPVNLKTTKPGTYQFKAADSYHWFDN